MGHPQRHVNVFCNQVHHAVFHRQDNFHLWVRFSKFNQQRHQIALTQWHRATNAQAPFDFALVLARQLLDIGQRQVDLLGLGIHLLTDLGQGQAPCRALNQPCAQFGLQLGQLARQHGFAAAHGQRRFADTAGLDDGRKNAKSLWVHRAHFLLLPLSQQYYAFLASIQATN